MQIRGTFFKEACEKFYPIVETGRVFTFSGEPAPRGSCEGTSSTAIASASGGRLKVAQKQFSSIKNDYEITFDTNSEIRPVDDDNSIQTVNFNFKKVRAAQADGSSEKILKAVVRSRSGTSRSAPRDQPWT
jgi:replication factor A1